MNRIPLWPLSAVQLERLAHATERRASLPQDRPAGMRLSTGCPVRRVKACFDERLRVTINPRHAVRGYFAEDLAEAAGLLEGCELQVTIAWGGGHESAWDAIDASGTPVSLKSTTRSDATPTTANREQDLRMLAADPSRGDTVIVWIIDMGLLEARGPYEHRFAQSELDAEAETMRKVVEYYDMVRAFPGGTQVAAWDDPDVWEFGCTCGGCFRRERFDANGAIERSIHRYWVGKQQEKAAKQLQADAREQLIAAAELLGHDRVRCYTAPLDISRGKRGWAIREYTEAGVDAPAPF